MLTEIKKRLLNNPIKIVEVLEFYGFKQPKLVGNTRITFGWSEDDSECSTRSKYIKLQNNPSLYVNDKSDSTNTNKDILNYIILEKNQDFKDVINKLKSVVGIENGYFEVRKPIFGGFYNTVSKRKHTYKQKTYDESILKNYRPMTSLAFMKDNISPQAQRFFNVCYDAISQRIVFPIYNWCGEIIGVKGRATWNFTEDECKYLYLIPCNINNTLYGYYQNYTYLQNEVIIICESEKAVMQAYSYGFRNIVSLGCSQITSEQCKLIVQLNPKRVIFCNDEGLDISTIENNVKTLNLYAKYKDIQIDYWDYRESKYVKEENERLKQKTNGEQEHCKMCITDFGKAIFYNILKGELKYEERMEID